METLDIALIKSNKTFEFKLPDNYVKCRQRRKAEIEVPLPGGCLRTRA